MVVVISEETGQVAYAHHGQLIRGVSFEELRSFLTVVLVEPAKSSRLTTWLRRWAQWRPQGFALPSDATATQVLEKAAPRDPSEGEPKCKPAGKLDTRALAKSQGED